MKGEGREPNSPSSASRPRAVMSAGDIAPDPGRTVRKNARRDSVMKSSLSTNSNSSKSSGAGIGVYRAQPRWAVRSQEMSETPDAFAILTARSYIKLQLDPRAKQAGSCTETSQ